MNSIPYSEVRAHLAETLKQLAGREEPVCISRRGEPAAVLMSMAQYQRLTAGAGKGVLSALGAWRKRNAVYLATPQAQADPFLNLRDASPDGGRPPLAFDAPEPRKAPRRKAVARTATKPR